MSYPIGGDFLPNPAKGSVVDYLYERLGKPFRQFLLELKNAPDAATRKEMFAEFNVARQLRGGNFIGRVEIVIDLSGTIQFNLEKPIAAGDWADWKEILSAIHGVENPQRSSAHTVVLELSGFYRNKARATKVATDAADLLHLKTTDLQI